MRPSVSTILEFICVVTFFAWPPNACGTELVDFSREVQPIFADHCYKCHGPDAKTRKAELRLDVQEQWREENGSAAPILVPGNRLRSELFRRITAGDVDERMPPPDHLPLTRGQIEILGRWIDQGAKTTPHWSHVPIRQPLLPDVAGADWIRQPLDRFTLHRMQAAGRAPAQPASRLDWLVRVSLDLTGLPPTRDEITAFINNQSPNAFESVVDRLLASPKYGENMAVPWLDLARYADTHGYHADTQRHMWRWRDWVIDALNANMPFDQFTIEQLAGDLLPNPTISQIIATGFHRNAMINFEDGSIADEYLIEYAADRAETTATVWLGQTMACARCHDHKYDPISQRDYYRFLAYFRNIDELGIDGRVGNAQPTIAAPTYLQNERISELKTQMDSIRVGLQKRRDSSRDAFAKWKQEMRQRSGNAAAPSDFLLHDALNGESDGATDSGSVWIPADDGKALLCNGKTQLTYNKLNRNSLTGPLTLSIQLFSTSTSPATLASVPSWTGAESISGSSRVKPADVVVALESGRVILSVRAGDADSTYSMQTKSVVGLRQWHRLAVTYDADKRPDGLQVFLDGDEQTLIRSTVAEGDEYQLGDALLLASEKDSESDGQILGFRGLLREFRVYSRRLSSDEIQLLSGSDPIHDILLKPPGKLTSVEHSRLHDYFLNQVDAQYGQLKTRLVNLERSDWKVKRSVPTTMVMRERADQRDTFVLKRGNYQFPGEKVTAGLPASFQRPTKDASNRLALARWLVSAENPLTARVAVNRYWQHFFGAGLVATPEDFGVRGQRPLNQALLDSLAFEFMTSGWDVKRLHRQIVLSATYRQSSKVNTRKWQGDSGNHWLARGPRKKLHAEAIRDRALFVSGLLDSHVGGASVYPKQPEGLWTALSFAKELAAQDYAASSGQDLYRRSLYTFWKRSAHHPVMEILGAPNREVCVVKRVSSNTTLESLVLMNDPTLFDAARQLAARISTSSAATNQDRVLLLYGIVFGRIPSAHEQRVAVRLLEENLAELTQSPSSVTQMVGHDHAELAAWATVINMLFTLDEFVYTP